MSILSDPILTKVVNIKVITLVTFVVDSITRPVGAGGF